jgi:alpha-tubulin suppressor-like RCC1 family protein
VNHKARHKFFGTKRRSVFPLLAFVVVLSLFLFSSSAAYAAERVAAGQYHSLTTSAGGLAWGSNDYGQLGLGFPTIRTSPVQVPGLTNVSAIAAADRSSFALRSDGTIWKWAKNPCWNDNGKSSPESVTDSSWKPFPGATAIASGMCYALALKPDGTVWAWGSNSKGQLGLTAPGAQFPTQVPGLTGVVSVAAGGNSSFAIKSDGTLWAWGYNYYGQLGDGTTTQRNSPVQVAGLTDVVAVASGERHTVAVKQDGTVWTWGDNYYGQLGDGGTTGRTTPAQVPGLSGVTAVSVGMYHSLALKSDGTVWAWGNNGRGQLGDGTTTQRNSPTQVPGLTNVTRISASAFYSHSMAVKSDGAVWAWGWNGYGQLGDGSLTDRSTPVQVSGLSDVADVSAGGYHSLARKTDGTVWAWGLDTQGQLGLGYPFSVSIPTRIASTGDPGSLFVQVAARRHSLAVRSDGTVWAWGENNRFVLGTDSIPHSGSPLQVPGLADVKTVAAGEVHSLALTMDGTVWAWGSNGAGQLGDGSPSYVASGTFMRATPGPVPSLSTVTAIAAGNSHSLALRDDGTVWAWGYNYDGQLGDGTGMTRNTPVQVPGLTGVIAIGAGNSFSMAVKADGSVWTWGANNYGQLGDGTTTKRLSPVQVVGLTDVVSVAGGESHSLAVKSDGTVWAWGSNSASQLGDGTTTQRLTPVQAVGLTDVESVAGGSYESLAARTDGTVWAWGNYSRKTPVQLDIGAGTLTTPWTVNLRVAAGQTGISLPLTFKAGAKGMNNGMFTIRVPDGWSVPSTTGTAPGYTTASVGTLSASGQLITVSGVTLAPGQTSSIVYGAKTAGGPGATASTTPGTVTFVAEGRTSPTDIMAPLPSSPKVDVLGLDGSGTLTVSPSGLAAGQTGQSLAFTFTVAEGGMDNGQVSIDVPPGWPAPSTDSTAPGYVQTSRCCLKLTGQNITVTSLVQAAGSTVTITYGSKAGGGPGLTAPTTPGPVTFAAQSKTQVNSTLKPLAVSPVATIYAADGSGTLTASETTFSAGQTGRTLAFTYTAGNGGMSDGAVSIAVPVGWSAPSLSGADPGFTGASTGTVSVNGQSILVDHVTLAGGQALTITYGDKTGGGPGATAPTTPGTGTFTAQSKTLPAGTLTALTASPTATVYGADGSGTMALPATDVSAGQTGRTLTFTYTAGDGGMSGGALTLAVPAGWSAPSTTGTAPGYTKASAGTVSVSGQTITVSPVTLAAGQTLTITYGDKASGGPGATAAATPGAATFTAQSKTLAGGTLKALAASPAATVYAADGSGTMTLPATSVSAGQTGRTLPFAFTVGTGGMNNGTVTIAVPAGWSAPSTVATAPGYVKASTGTVTVSGQTITVTGVTGGTGAVGTVTYGDKSGGGPGATVSATPGTGTFAIQSKSVSGSTLKPLVVSPAATVYAADGSGSLTLPETVFTAGQTGLTLPFTLTAAAGGTDNGTVTLTVPAGWTAPSVTPTAGGYTTATAGTLSVSGQTITVSGVSLTGGQPLTVTYGNRSGGGPGLTAPLTQRTDTFAAQQKSTVGGVLTAMANQPTVRVDATTLSVLEGAAAAPGTKLSLRSTSPSAVAWTAIEYRLASDPTWTRTADSGVYTDQAATIRWTVPTAVGRWEVRVVTTDAQSNSSVSQAVTVVVMDAPSGVTVDRAGLTTPVLKWTPSLSGTTLKAGAGVDSVYFAATAPGGGQVSVAATAGAGVWTASWPSAWSQATAWSLSVMACVDGTACYLTQGESVTLIPSGTVKVLSGQAITADGTFRLELTSPSAVQWFGPEWRQAGGSNWTSLDGTGALSPGTPATITVPVPKTPMPFQVRFKLVDASGAVGYTQPVLMGAPYVGAIRRSDGSLAVPTQAFNPGNWTVDLLLRPGSGATGERYIWSMAGANGNTYSLLQTADGRVHAVVTSGQTQVDTLRASDPVLQAGQTYRITVRGDGNMIAVFVNRVKLGAGDLAYTEPDGSLPLTMYFGANATEGTGAGTVTHVRWFGRALTDAEIAAFAETGQSYSSDPTGSTVEVVPGL